MKNKIPKAIVNNALVEVWISGPDAMKVHFCHSVEKTHMNVPNSRMFSLK